MYIFNYKCDCCNFEASAVRGAVGYYRFDNGSELSALTTPVWCNQCMTITVAEALPDIAFLRSELVRFMSGDYTEADREHAAFFSESVEALVTSRIEFIRNWISRFEHRILAGRCIECGSFSYQKLASFADDGNLPDAFVHPGCNGILRLINSWHASPATLFVLNDDGTRASASNRPELGDSTMTATGRMDNG